MNDRAPSLAFKNLSDEFYIAYVDFSSNALVAKTYNGTSWVQLGPNIGINLVCSPSLAFKPTTNEAYVAYADDTANAILVKKYSGTNWMKIGNLVGYSKAYAVPSLVFKPTTNEPWVAYSDSVTNGMVVKMFNGTSWVQVGSNLSSSSGTTIPALAFDKINNQPYVIYGDTSLSAYIVKTFNGTNWVQVGSNLGGNVGFYDHIAYHPSIAFHPVSNEPYVGYSDFNLSQSIVQKYSSNSWSQVGASINSIGFQGGGTSIVFHPSTHELFRAYKSETDGDFNLEKYNGNNWVIIHNIIDTPPKEFTSTPMIAFDYCKESLYLAFNDNKVLTVEYENIPCAPIQINTQPTNQSVNISNNAVFAVSSQSRPCLTYHWQTDIGFGFQNLSNAGQYSGVFTNTLTVANTAMINNNQLFRCKIANTASCTDSTNTVNLTVINNVGIDELKNNNFTIYPNPAENYFTITVSELNKNFTIYLYNALGQEVYSKYVAENKSQNIIINTTNFAKGIYSVCVQTKDGNAFNKLIIK